MSVDERKQRGFVPKYGPSAYKGFEGPDGRKRGDVPPMKEAGSGTNKGGYGRPLPDRDSESYRTERSEERAEREDP